MTTGRLLDDETLERFRRVMPVVEMLNKKYGRDTVRLAGANPKGRWRTKAAKRPALHDEAGGGATASLRA